DFLCLHYGLLGCLWLGLFCDFPNQRQSRGLFNNFVHHPLVFFQHSDCQLDGIHFKKLDAGRSDAPTCVDCHGAHKIENPNGMTFRASVHLVCGKCHGDAERMKKYNLNPNVLSTYLDDFHGMSNQLYQAEGATGTKPFKQIATCIDCHGAHDVMSLRKATSKGEIQKRILTSCTACHKDAKLLMADAWLSHQKPTRQTAPLVWLVKKIYGILISMIMAGLVLHILLHLWRLRARRSGSQK
ncbi:cytochrome c3 family protein, partial [Bdellovibrionota bacterium FG-1]